MSERSDPEVGRQLYLTRWRPRDYLDEYYATAVTRDDLAHTRFATRELRNLGRGYRRALEVGCGPTVQHVAPFAPWVDQVTMADYLPQNLAEVRAWLDGDASAFDWDPWLASTIAAVPEVVTGSGHAPDRADALSICKARIRSVVCDLQVLDLLAAEPTDDSVPAKFDLVFSYYCLECVGGTRDSWLAGLRRVTDRVALDGVLFLGVIRRGSTYRVLDTTFPVATIDVQDLRDELPRLGFPLADLVIEVADVPEFAAHGFDQVLCVRAIKRA